MEDDMLDYEKYLVEISKEYRMSPSDLMKLTFSEYEILKNSVKK